MGGGAPEGSVGGGGSRWGDLGCWGRWARRTDPLNVSEGFRKTQGRRSADLWYPPCGRPQAHAMPHHTAGRRQHAVRSTPRASCTHHARQPAFPTHAVGSAHDASSPHNLPPFTVEPPPLFG